MENDYDGIDERVKKIIKDETELLESKLIRIYWEGKTAGLKEAIENLEAK